MDTFDDNNTDGMTAHASTHIIDINYQQHQHQHHENNNQPVTSGTTFNLLCNFCPITKCTVVRFTASGIFFAAFTLGIFGIAYPLSQRNKSGKPISTLAPTPHRSPISMPSSVTQPSPVASTPSQVVSGNNNNNNNNPWPDSSNAPGNDRCDSAISIVTGVPVYGTTVGATDESELGLNPICARSTAVGVWYDYVGEGRNVVACLSAPTFPSVKISVFAGSCLSTTCVGLQPFYYCADGSIGWVWFANYGVPYIILIWDEAVGEFAFMLN